MSFNNHLCTVKEINALNYSSMIFCHYCFFHFCLCIVMNNYKNVSNVFVVNVSVSVFCEKLSIEFIISSSWIFWKWKSNNLNFCLSRLMLLLNLIVFAKCCNKSMIMSKKTLCLLNLSDKDEIAEISFWDLVSIAQCNVS
jgi:hypothetical protein